MFWSHLAKAKCDFSPFIFPPSFYFTSLSFPLPSSSSLSPFAYTSDQIYSLSLPDNVVTMGMDVVTVLKQTTLYLKVFNYLQAELHVH